MLTIAGGVILGVLGLIILRWSVQYWEIVIPVLLMCALVIGGTLAMFAGVAWYENRPANRIYFTPSQGKTCQDFISIPGIRSENVNGTECSVWESKDR